MLFVVNGPLSGCCLDRHSTCPSAWTLNEICSEKELYSFLEAGSNWNFDILGTRYFLFSLKSLITLEQDSSKKFSLDQNSVWFINCLKWCHNHHFLINWSYNCPCIKHNDFILVWTMIIAFLAPSKLVGNKINYYKWFTDAILFLVLNSIGEEQFSLGR